jgi:hypothetical protein
VVAAAPVVYAVGLGQVVDSGFSFTHVTPIFEHKVVSSAVKRWVPTPLQATPQQIPYPLLLSATGFMSICLRRSALQLGSGPSCVCELRS